MANWRQMALAIAIAGVITGGCAEEARESAEPMGEVSALKQATRGEGFADRANEAPPPPAPAKPAEPGAKEARPANPAAAESRYIIRRSDLTIEVEAVRPAVERVSAIASRLGGFVSDSSLTANEGARPQATLTLRVPARQFDAALNELGGVGTVRQRQVSSEDVTLQYVDTQSRIRNLQQQEAQLLKLLTRTGKLSEVLEVERELARVRGEIEQSQGRLRHLSALVDLATLTVHLTEQVQVANASPWQLPAVWENAWNDVQRRLARTVSDVVRGAVWLVGYVLPLVIPALLLYALVGVGLRKGLVDKAKLTDARTFRRAWLAVGAAILCLLFPPLFGFVALVAVLVLVAWAASGLWRRFVPRRDRD